VLGRPKRCKLAHALLWEYGYEGLLKLAQLLGQLGVFCTWDSSAPLCLGTTSIGACAVVT
jgi:hypothetical protein